jgi:hypothetical protein
LPTGERQSILNLQSAESKVTVQIASRCLHLMSEWDPNYHLG